MKEIKKYWSDFATEVHNSNKYHNPELYEVIENHVKRSKDFEGFIDNILNDESIKFEQITAELMKRSEKEWYFARSQMKEVFKTDSDCGGLKIGNNEFYIIVPNGYGDGITRVSVQERNTINTSTFKFYTSIKGKFNIYDYDCGGDIIKELNGKYYIYYFNGLIVFMKD